MVNFYNTTPVSQFKPGKVDVKSALDRLDDLFTISDCSFELDNAEEIEKLLLDRHIFKKDKASQVQELLLKPATNKADKKRNKEIAKQITNAILESSVKFNDLFYIDLDKEEVKEWNFRLDDAELDTKIQNINSKLDTNQQLIIDELQKLFSSVTLSDILKGCADLPDAKIASYNKHKRDLNLYLKFIKLIDKDQGTALKEAYDLYINNSRKNLVELRKKWKNNAPKDADSFYKAIKPIVASVKTTHVDQDDDDSALKYDEKIRHYADVILEQIDRNNFLTKQRTSENTYIPYQLNALTFNAILRNQGKHYPLLVEPNPCEHDRKEAPYKLSQLMQFTIPYFVGPLITPEEEAKQGVPEKDRFAWLVRKSEGNITPWNFYEKVDVVETANQFIKRSIAKDTFLLSYPVLPKNSMIYQKYMVYEELSDIKLNGKNLKPALKQWIYENVFKRHTTVTAARLKKALSEDYNMPGKIELSGFTDIRNPKFNSTLSTYNSWKKIFGNIIDEPSYQNDFERMIEWSTVFEDRTILAIKLKEIEWLTDRQRKFVIGQRLTGWGRFSKKLLLDIKDNHGKSILQNMVTTKRNFMQIINTAVYQTQIDKITVKVTRNEALDSILDRSYTSPANRKAIRQAVKVLEDLIKVNNDVVPEKIML